MQAAALALLPNHRLQARLKAADRAANDRTSDNVAQSLPELEAQITELAGHLNSGNHRFLLLVSEFDRCNGWAASGTRSCAHWLNWKCGIDLGAAREKVRVANALENVPRISAAMARGQISYSKVRALTRVATPETEELLLTIALHGTADHVETTVRCFRKAQQAEELSREARQRAARRLSYFHDEDGSLVFKGSLPAETGALFMKAIDAAVEAADRADRADHADSPNRAALSRPAIAGFRSVSGTASIAGRLRPENRGDHQSVSAETPTDRAHVASQASHGSRDSSGTQGSRDPNGTQGSRDSNGIQGSRDSDAQESPTPGERPTLSVRRADALARIAESFLAHGAEALSGGDRYQIVVHVDAQMLREGGAGRCEHDHGPAMPVETARRLCCDSSVVSIVEGENGEPLNVGRKTRSIPPALRRALNSRDRGCRFPGCSNRHYVDGHHIQHWANGGETRLSNLALLCRFHHTLVHEGGVSIQVLNDGALRFVMKDGRSFDSLKPVRPGTETGPLADDVLHGDWAEMFAAHAAMDIVITPKTAVTRWTGESMDYGTATDALLYRTHRARRNATASSVSAET